MQDDYAIQSFERGIAARDSGAFDWEITPVRFKTNFTKKNGCLEFLNFMLMAMYGTLQVEVPGPRGRPSTIVDKDDDLSKVLCCTYII